MTAPSGDKLPRSRTGPGTPRPSGKPARVGIARRLGRFARRIGVGRAVAVVLLAMLLMIRIWDPPVVEAIRTRTFDAFQVVKPREPLPERPVVIVDLDEASMQTLGQWPWPRTRLADLVDRLTGMGALVIAFDVVFADPDRLSPDLYAASLGNLSAEARAELMGRGSNDRVFAKAIGESRVVLGQTATREPIAWTAEAPPPQTGIAVIGVDPDPGQALLRFPGVLRNVPALEFAASGRGVFTIAPETDGIVRRVPMVLQVEGRVVPALSLEVVRVLTGADSIRVKTDEAGVAEIGLPELRLQTDSRGRIWVHFSPHDPKKFVSAGDVLAGRVAPERVQNRIVLVGSSALGLLDNRTTPIDRSMPGVEIHAQLLENMLSGTTLVSPNYAVFVELLATAAVSIAIILFAPILGAFNLMILGSAVAGFLAYASWYRYAQSGILIDATFPLFATFSVYLTIVFTNYFREQFGRVRIRSAFGQYLSPALVEQLAQSPEKLKLGGEERRMTIMFSDVRGFTTISEFYKRDPVGLTHLMNRFLTPLTNAILDRKGTIDKYMGDAIMAFWNAPLEDDDQEVNAVQAALDMLDRMDQLNALRKTEAESGGFPVLPLDVGIGINTGICVVGNMGSDLRFDYSVLGDTVNLASRLEGQSKYYGVKVILGSATAAAVGDIYPVLDLDLIQVKGKTEPEAISTLVGDPTFRQGARFRDLAERHGAMIAAYRARNWDETAYLAGECRRLAEGLRIDGLYRLYIDRAAAFRETPPPEDWAGIYVAETK